MAIKVNGTLANGVRNYQNPILVLVPHLEYRGKISMDLHIKVEEIVKEVTENEEALTRLVQVDTIPMYPEASELYYPTTQINPYNDLIYALETHVISALTPKNPNSTFTRI
jgi:hypothetical protein